MTRFILLTGVNDQSLPRPPWETQSDESPWTPPVQNGLPGGVMHPQFMQNSQFGGTPEQMQVNQQMGMFLSPLQSSQQSGMVPLQMQNDRLPSTFSQPMQNGLQPGMHPSWMQNNQVPGPFSQQVQGGRPTGYTGYMQQQPRALYDQRQSYPSYSSPNEISQGMYGLSVQNNGTYANAGPSYQTPTSPYMQQFKKPSRPEDNLFGDLVSMAKTKQNKTTASDAGNS